MTLARFLVPVLLVAVMVDGMVAAAAAGATTACPSNVTPVKAGAAAAGKTGYTTKYDNIDVKMILRNERLLKNYVDCLMDRKPCSREGQLLRGEFLFRKAIVRG